MNKFIRPVTLSESEIKKIEANKIARSEANPNHFEKWYPAIVEAGLRTPATVVFPITPSLAKEVGKETRDVFQFPELVALVQNITPLFDSMGDRLFMKNSLYSGKHSWAHTCELTRDCNIALKIVTNLYEWLMLSPDYASSIVVREMIKTAPVFTAFQSLPITQEFRVFAKDGHAYAYQPYWPAHAIEDYNPSEPDWRERLAAISEPSPSQLDEIISMAGTATAALGGDWSVDILYDESNTAYLIDMAVASQSYKDPDCRSLQGEDL
ncbi:MAG: hypothetical protein GY774_22825 [Planctomycetes bacterium]|nr:hypothetical protein [Planctomycetota bacterium]